MNTKTYNKDVLEFEHQQGLLKPNNQAAIDFISNLKHKETVYLKDIGQRDIKFHRAYFGLLNYIYSWMPVKFKMRIPEKIFYTFIKDLTGQYTIWYTFKNGREITEYTSISFGRMSQKTFEEYVKNQLPMIYDNLIYVLFDAEEAEMIIENIEFEWEKFLDTL